MVRLSLIALVVMASSVSAATENEVALHRVRGLGGRATGYTCKEAMEQGWLTTYGNLGIENKGKDDPNSVNFRGDPVTLPFQDFPCGNFNSNGTTQPFDGSGKALKCTYCELAVCSKAISVNLATHASRKFLPFVVKEIDQYECECSAGNCREIIAAVTDTDGGPGFPGGVTSQPCTALGYALTSRVKTYLVAMR
jgi:hypothetical protein